MPSRKRAGPSGFMGALRGQRLCSRRAPSSLNPSILTISRLGRVTYPSRHSKVVGILIFHSRVTTFQEEKFGSYFFRAPWRIQFLLPLVPRSTSSDRLLAHAAMKNWIFRVCAAGERSTTGRHATINVPLRLKMVTVHFSWPAAGFDPHILNLAGMNMERFCLHPYYLLQQLHTISMHNPRGLVPNGYSTMWHCSESRGFKSVIG